MTTGQTTILIRDGLIQDVNPCLALDHSYETSHVWQMALRAEHGSHHLDFRPERLPRPVEQSWPADQLVFRSAMGDDGLFLVAETADDRTILGYLAGHVDPLHGTLYLDQIVVDREYRRQHIGTRLLRVAGQWASEQAIARLTLIAQTSNYPVTEFCQSLGYTFCGYNDQLLRNDEIAIFYTRSVR
jgi:ribosomal protein S18 acetylase RimI-like enzyme